MEKMTCFHPDRAFGQNNDVEMEEDEFGMLECPICHRKAFYPTQEEKKHCWYCDTYHVPGPCYPGQPFIPGFTDQK